MRENRTHGSEGGGGESRSRPLSPDVPLFVAPDEKAFAVMDSDGRFTCPHCGKSRQDAKAFAENNSPELGKAKNKKVELTLLIHPQWLEGCPKHDEEGHEYGGSATDSVAATIRWNNARSVKLRLLEVRGTLPDQVTCPETGVTFRTDTKGGTSAKAGKFACGQETCGTEQSIVGAAEATGKSAPWAASVIHGYSPHRDAAGIPYSGRHFAVANATLINAAFYEWEERKNADLKGYWPRSPIPFGHMTHQRNPLERHGIKEWWHFFNYRQLLINSLLLKALTTHPTASDTAKESVLGAFQQFLRNNNLFCIWDREYDKLVPHLSNNNFNPKNNVVENCVFPRLGRGNWSSCTDGAIEGLSWTQAPWEVASVQSLQSAPIGANEKSHKIPLRDRVQGECRVVCHSASAMTGITECELDLVVTDPPFGGLLHYAELSDFFYVWLRLVLRGIYPDEFEPEYTPKALEAIASKARHPEDPDGFYQRILTDCWREAYRVLKPGGILAFTFHHSEDEPWVGVLESLFDAGFYLEATYPIRSDETKGEGEFGSKQIEYDIIHVCRKRNGAELQPISWARLRRLITDDVRHLKRLLEQHRNGGLPAADLDIIKRGKALEYFSRHYGKVFIEQGREFTIRDALPAIKLLVDEEADATSGIEAPPANAEPYTRQFFRLFYETCQVPRDQMQKFLRGTGIAPGDFEERGWFSEKSKVFTLTPPVDLARAWKGLSRKGMARDFDQTMFLVGACFEGSNIRVTDTLDSPNFAPHPATAELVDWLARHGGTQDIKFAAQRARTIYRDWLAKDENKKKALEQLKLFDIDA